MPELDPICILVNHFSSFLFLLMTIHVLFHCDISPLVFYEIWRIEKSCGSNSNTPNSRYDLLPVSLPVSAKVDYTFLFLLKGGRGKLFSWTE